MKLNDFLQKKAWKHWDKSQWSILILAGILLMVLAIPTKEKKDEADTVRENALDAAQTADAKEDYRKDMEVRLKKALSKIAGAGEVEVMITLEDAGESIVEKDLANDTSKVQETDTSGTGRKEERTQKTLASVYAEENSTKTPFVGKELMPKVAGVLIVAQGGEDTLVKQNISEAVMALFQIDVNRIKVVKMSIQEEEY